jgi:hypothetical protein
MELVGYWQVNAANDAYENSDQPYHRLYPSASYCGGQRFHLSNERASNQIAEGTCCRPNPGQAYVFRPDIDTSC